MGQGQQCRSVQIGLKIKKLVKLLLAAKNCEPALHVTELTEEVEFDMGKPRVKTIRKLMMSDFNRVLSETLLSLKYLCSIERMN
jgi:hypothetical protein